MIAMSFPRGVGAQDVQQIRHAVQEEASARGLGPQHGFMLLFVVDELCCNVMEHSRAAWAELKVEANPTGFRLVLTDDGVPFDLAGQVRSASGQDLKGEDDRRLGLNLIGRLVDDLKYDRTPEGLNRVEMAKSF
jgi:anti-sigma regulatory factor (Ser/Thr protein kinase)